jgi:hypothetical protein
MASVTANLAHNSRVLIPCDWKRVIPVCETRVPGSLGEKGTLVPVR